MSISNLIDSFSDFKYSRNIDRPTLIRVLEDVFRTLIRKKYSTDENFDIIVNDDEGDLEIDGDLFLIGDESFECSCIKGKSFVTMACNTSP